VPGALCAAARRHLRGAQGPASDRLGGDEGDGQLRCLVGSFGGNPMGLWWFNSGLIVVNNG